MKKRFGIIFALCVYFLFLSGVQASLFDDIFNPDKTFVVPQVSVDIKKPTSIGTQNIKIIETQFEKIKKKLERFGPIKKKEIYTQASKNITNLVKSRTNKFEKDALNYLNTLVKREINTLTTSEATLNELFGIEEKECIVGYIYKDDECIKATPDSSSKTNKKICSINNGYGYQYWDGYTWGKCNIEQCNEGYYISNNSCLRNNYSSCAGNEHLENGKCVSNYNSCTVSNGYGRQHWTGGYRSTCYAESCHSGYYLSGGNCLRKSYDTCSSNEHLENGYCVSNSRSCSVSNGYGRQNWNGSYWASCYADSCYSGYYLSGGSCIRNNYYENCSSNEHLENGYCVSNSRSCSVSNGYGRQNWNGSYWASCYADSCYSGYYLSGGSCIRNSYESCSSNEHLENGYCVSNTKTCSITNGLGRQTWLGNYWGTCYVQTCNSGYYIFANSCESY